MKLTPNKVAYLAVTTPQSSEHTFFQTCEQFMLTARQNGIFLRWLSYRESFHGGVYSKFQRFKDMKPKLEQQGFTHAFVLDAPGDTIFTATPTDTLRAYQDWGANCLPRGVAIGVEEVDLPEMPYQGEEFRKVLNEEGLKFSSTKIFGSLDAIEDMFDICIGLSRDFLAEAPQLGIATTLMADRKDFYPNLARYANDAHFLLQLASIYHRNRFCFLPKDVWNAGTDADGMETSE